MPQQMRIKLHEDRLLQMPSLFPNGLAAVIGLPADFELSKKLSTSRVIKIATAFAHKSGWDMIKDSVLRSSGEVRIIAGLHFFQTEPLLLESWLKESCRSDKFVCHVVSTSSPTRWTFHPKVLIVKNGEGRGFAIVGSGNLSAGGLCNNLECSLYTEDPPTLSSLEQWFDDLEGSFTRPLDPQTIRCYKPLYMKYRTRNVKSVRAQFKELKELDQKVDARGGTRLRKWRRAVEDAKKLFANPKFNNRWEERNDAAKGIRSCLHYPEFNFNYAEWQEFLQITTFGNLGALHFRRQSIKKQMGRLRSAFKLLTDESQDIRSRLQRVLSGDAKVRWIDMNVVTKLLTVHDSKRWPVYNSLVRNVLAEYDYEIPRGLAKAEKYLDYAKLMQQFSEAAQAKDMWALDIFFLDRFQKGRSSR